MHDVAMYEPTVKIYIILWLWHFVEQITLAIKNRRGSLERTARGWQQKQAKTRDDKQFEITYHGRLRFDCASVAGTAPHHLRPLLPLYHRCPLLLLHHGDIVVWYARGTTSRAELGRLAHGQARMKEGSADEELQRLDLEVLEEEE